MMQHANGNTSSTPVPDAALDGIAQTIVERVHPDRIDLFGSRARGDARPGSDNDLESRCDDAGRVSELPPASVHDWLALAADDLDAVDAMLAHDHVPWASVCFHAHQAAEKYLKVLLIARAVRPPRTHKLSTLVRLAREMHCDLPDLDAECSLLQPYAATVRYADRVPTADESTGRAAVDAGSRIVDAARRVLAR